MNNKVLKTIIIITIILLIMIILAFTCKNMEQKSDTTNTSNNISNNNYIQNIEMDYIEEDKVKFKADCLIMDDINFSLVLDFITDSSVENFEGISLQGLEITDDKKNQIYIPSEDQNIWTKNIALMEDNWEVIEKSGNSLRQVIHLYSNNFPKSNKIYVSFDRIVLYNVNQGNPKTIEYEGDYKLEFDVPKEIAERNTIEYINDSSEIIKNVKLTNTALAVTVDSDGYISTDDNYTVTDDKGNVYTLINTLRIFDIKNVFKSVADKQVLIFNMTIENQCDNLTLKSPNGQTYILTKTEI